MTVRAKNFELCVFVREEEVFLGKVEPSWIRIGHLRLGEVNYHRYLSLFFFFFPFKILCQYQFYDA